MHGLLSELANEQFHRLYHGFGVKINIESALTRFDGESRDVLRSTLDQPMSWVNFAW